MGVRKWIAATLFGLYFLLPRLFIGAHWLSDIVLGSLPIALFSIACTYYTPFFHYGVVVIEKGLYKLFPKLNPAYKIEIYEKA
jgi:membrane-associated phospholipid phosphatase